MGAAIGAVIGLIVYLVQTQMKKKKENSDIIDND